MVMRLEKMRGPMKEKWADLAKRHGEKRTFQSTRPHGARPLLSISLLPVNKSFLLYNINIFAFFAINQLQEIQMFTQKNLYSSGDMYHSSIAF